jgi:hypothetical protein
MRRKHIFFAAFVAGLAVIAASVTGMVVLNATPASVQTFIENFEKIEDEMTWPPPRAPARVMAANTCIALNDPPPGPLHPRFAFKSELIGATRSVAG